MPLTSEDRGNLQTTDRFVLRRFVLSVDGNELLYFLWRLSSNIICQFATNIHTGTIYTGSVQTFHPRKPTEERTPSHVFSGTEERMIKGNDILTVK